MVQGLDVEFEVLNKDRLICRVYKDEKGERSIEYFTENKVEKSFCPFEISDAGIEEYYRERIFPETRVDKKRVLRELGLYYYDPEMICRRTKGMLVDDTYWVRFKGDEGLSYEEAKKLVYEN